MEEKKIERRCSAATYEVRSEGDSRRVVGYASVFDSPSEDMGYREVIKQGAFDGVILVSDVFALLNHDMSRGVLARSNNGNGSLTLSIDENGLKYEFDAPHTALGDELLEGIKRGDIGASSFAFTVAEERWEKQADNTYIRYVEKIEKLYDVSPVYQPAYEATSCDLRGLEAAKKAEADAEAKAKEQAQKELQEIQQKLIEKLKMY